MNNVEIYQEGQVWYVRFEENGETKTSEPFINESDAISFSLNLKFI